MQAGLGRGGIWNSLHLPFFIISIALNPGIWARDRITGGRERVVCGLVLSLSWLSDCDMRCDVVPNTKGTPRRISDLNLVVPEIQGGGFDGYFIYIEADCGLFIWCLNSAG
jgi:hypothetical protein